MRTVVPVTAGALVVVAAVVAHAAGIELTVVVPEWLSLVGVVGMTLRGGGPDGERDAVEDLTERVERAADGEDVEFPTDRDDELGELSAAVGRLAEALRECERERDRQASLVDSLVEGAPTNVYVKDREGRHVRTSTPYFRDSYADVDEEWFRGKTDPELYPDDLAEESHEDDVRVVETGEPIRDKLEHNPESDDWLLTSKVPWEGPDGETLGLIGVSREITDHVERERRLTETKDRLTEHNRALRRLYQISADPDASFGEKVESILDLGRERLGTDGAFLSTIEPEEGLFTIEYETGTIEQMEAGSTSPLSETYCRRALKAEGVLAVTDAGNQGWEDDVAYDTWDYDCYVGARVHVGDDLYGTLCFVDHEACETGFTEDERAFVELASQWVGYEFERRRYRRRIEGIVENTPDPIFIKDSDGVYQFVNEAAARTFGLDPSEVIGRTDDELFDPDGIDDVRAGDEQVLETGETVTRETETVVDGEERVFLDTKYPYRDVDGRVVGVMGISRDVTERKERERELEETKRRLELALAETDTGVWEWVLETDEARWGESLERALGMEPGSFEGTYEAFEQRIHPDDRPRMESALEEAVEEGDPYRVDYRMRHEDGGWRWFESRGRLVDDDSRMVGIRHDITERKERERELREANERLNKIIEASPDAIIALDSDGSVELWNSAAERIFGWSAEEVVGERPPLVPEEETSEYDRLVERILGGESVAGVEVERLRKDGERVDVNLSAAPLRDDEGDVVGIMGALEDITERKERERELERTRDMLEQSQRLASVGAWEVEVVDGRPVDMVWTDEVYRIHDMPVGVDVDLNDGIEFYHPDDRPGVQHAVERAIRAGRAYEFEARLVTPGGDQRWVRSIADPVTEDGEVVALRGSIQDVTERKERERDLRETTRRLELALEGTNTGIWEYDPEAGDLHWNETEEALVGLDPGEFEGTYEAFRERVHPDDRERIGAALDRSIEAGERFQSEFRMRNEDGDWIWVGARGRVVTDEDGTERVLGINNDITERKERERDLRETTRRLELALEGTNTGIWEYDPETEAVVWNETEEALVGLDPGEFEGTYEAFRERAHPEDIDRVGAALERTVETGELFQTEFRMRHEDGDWIWVGGRGRVVTDEDGSTRVVGINNDITDRKESEREVRETRDRLAEHNRTLRRLYEISADRDASLDEKIEDLLELGRERFGVDGAFVSEVDRAADRFEFSHTSGTIDVIEQGSVVSFSETYCQRVADTDGVVEAVHADEEPWLPDPAYERWDLDFYVGAPVYVGGGFAGTVAFVDEEGGDATLTDDQRAFVDLAAQWVGYELERRRKERELREYREFTDDILDAIDDVFYIVDGDGSVQRWNDTLPEVTGYDDEAIAEMDATEFFAADHRERIADAIGEVFETGDTLVEAPFRTSDGESIPYEFVASRVEDPDGEVMLAGVGRDVTERNERERQLRERERALQRYKEFTDEILDAIDDVFYIVGPDGGLERWNESMREVTGYTDEEIDAMDATEFFPDDYEETVLETIEEAFETGDARVELPVLTSEGERIYFEILAVLVENPDGEQRLAGIGRDISERRERERELERTADLLGRAEEMADLGGWSVELSDGGPGTARWTDKLYEIFEIPPDEDPPTKGVFEYYHPDDREAHRETVDHATETGERWDEELRVLTPDGTERWVRSIGEPVTEDGEVVEIRGSVQDISERKERERELERTRDLLQQAGRIAGIGGWELDLRADPPEMSWTDELYRLHDLPPDTEIDVETAVEFYHPDDRERIRELFARAAEIGEGYDMEVRLQTAADEQRWVRAIGEPVVADGEVVSIRGSIQDVTDRKERELALESLHETTRGLLGTESTAESAELVVEAAAGVLDVDPIGLYLLDAESNRLEPAATTDRFEEVCGGAPAVSPGDDSVLWNCFVTGTPTVFDDSAAVGDSRLFGTDARGGLIVPMGDHGVFVVATPDPPVGDETRQLAETLVATAEAAFDRIQTESELRDRDAELEARNRRLQRQIAITDVIRRVDRSLIGAGSREEVETAVCERLAESDDVGFAWIGGPDPSGEQLEPRAWAGAGGDYLDAVDLTLPPEGATLDAGAVEPAAGVARGREPAVVENVVEHLQRDDWAKTALAADFHSVVAVPLVYENYFYGVLAVYAAEPDTFGDLERTVFAELGEGIAHSVNAVETQRALHADALTELTLRVDEPDDLLGRLARETDCRIEYEGMASHSGDQTRFFVTVGDADPSTVAAFLDDSVAVSGFRQVDGADGDDDSGDGDGSARAVTFELTVEGETLPSRLVRHGASPQSIDVTAGGTDVVVDVPTSTDVREFVEMLDGAYPGVELVARRTVERAAHTRGELVSSLFEALTDRQLEVLRTAYFAGFFDWPRASTGEEVADMLDVTQPTVNRHLRLGQKRLFEQLFDGESAVRAG